MVRATLNQAAGSSPAASRALTSHPLFTYLGFNSGETHNATLMKVRLAGAQIGLL